MWRILRDVEGKNKRLEAKKLYVISYHRLSIFGFINNMFRMNK